MQSYVAVYLVLVLIIVFCVVFNSKWCLERIWPSSEPCAGWHHWVYARSRWSIQINRRHTSAGTCGLQRDFCGSDLSTGWNGSYSKPFHSAARWLMLSLDCLWKLQGCKSLERTVSVWEASWFGGGGGGFECVFDSVKKVNFYFCGFHKWWEDGECKKYILVFLPPPKCVTTLFRAERREHIVMNCLRPSWSCEFWNNPIKLVKNALNIGYIFSIFKYIKMYLIWISLKPKYSRTCFSSS